MPSSTKHGVSYVDGVPVVPATSFMHVFSEASMSNPMNATIAKLGRSEKDVLLVRQALAEMGQKQFINFSRSYLVSATALALYAGDGIVAKVISDNELGHLKGVIYHTPSIKKAVVEGGDDRYHVRLYPWIPPGKVGSTEIEQFADQLADYRLAFNDGDAYPKNVHRLPDKEGTFIGIDSHMYHEVQPGMSIPESHLAAWHSYLHRLYPIYKTEEVAPQTPQTSFKGVSLHDPRAGLVSFQEFLEQSGRMEPPEPDSFSL